MRSSAIILKLATGSLGVLLGFAGARWIPWTEGRDPEPSGTFARIPPSVLPEMAGTHADELRSFRELLLAQNGQSTVTATRTLFNRIHATRSPAVLEEMRRELTLMHDLLDPVPGLLAAVIAEHLDHHSPTSRAALQGDAATRQAIADRVQALRDWAYRDPDAAFAFALKEPIVNHRPLMLEAALQGAVVDPDAAYRLWSTLSDPDLRHRLAKSIAREIARARPEQHAEWAAAFPTETETVREICFREWSTKSLEDALVALNKLEKAGEDVRSARLGLLAGWGKSDPAAAAVWGDEYGAFFPRDVMLQWADNDPAAALAYALAHPDDHRLETVATAWLQKDAASTLTWIEENLSNAERLEVYRQVFRDQNISDSLPEAQRGEMAAWLAGDPHPHAQEAAGKYLRSFEKASAAQEWIETLPVVHERRLMPIIFDKWIRESPDDAARFIDSLPTARAQAAILRETLELPFFPEDNKPLKEWAQRHLSADAWEHLNAK